jgi:cell division protein ZapA
MTQVSVTLNERTYGLRCAAGEVDRLLELATYVKAKFDELQAAHGKVGDERLLMMTAIMIADELWDARAATPATPRSGARKAPVPA